MWLKFLYRDRVTILLPILAIICNQLLPFLATLRSIKIAVFGNFLNQNVAKNGKNVTQVPKEGHREPYFFQNTLFVVDRFHWRGHVGCSSGYCLDIYQHMAMKKINSQVNEQANAGLQRIRGQLAYMTPENFMFTLKLFLTIKNKDVQRKLDMSLLHV